MDISIVIPLLNEDESLPELHDWIARVMEANKFSYELLFIDDGSTDSTLDQLIKQASLHQSIRVIEFSRNFGKEAALSAGLFEADGEAMIPIDVDLQDPPEVINQMLNY